MKKLRGTLHIALSIHNGGSEARAYDVTYTLENGDASSPPLGTREYLRRFYSGWELAEFLARDMNCDAEKAIAIVHRVKSEGHARIEGLEMEDWKLRGLNLAA
ncbi:MAG: hypothetical protein ABSD20_04765 [Terriglobales bacterium]|jgi:hypothetical protein